MKKKNITNSQGILFWLTGLSGSGKSSIAKNIKSKIIKEYGPTIVFNGDDLRKILDFKGYTIESRLDNGYKFSKLFKFILNQKINVIFAGIGLFHKLRSYNKKNIKNYLEIYIKSDLKKIIYRRKKKIYLKKNLRIVGRDLRAEFPKTPDIIINNNFKKSVTTLSNELFKKIKNKI
jgi:adenylylsulfate kinase-like enzyme